MYWYNPTKQISEGETIRILAGHPDSAAFVSEYAELRHSGMEIETALTMVGHQVRLRNHEHPSVRQTSHERPRRSRPRASGYKLLMAVRLREEGREVRDRRLVYRS